MQGWHLLSFGYLLLVHHVRLTAAATCIQGTNCLLPNCFCPTFKHPNFSDPKTIPQMVYFGFDDAVHGQAGQHYNSLFNRTRVNPNGCPISMSLYVQDQWTNYDMVKMYYEQGMEIGVHSVTHTNVDTEDKILFEAGKQKENLATMGHVPADQIVGWRSPNLKPAGDAQPEVLKRLGYTYDISLTYAIFSLGAERPWPYTLDYGYPYSCSVPECPSRTIGHPGFWEIPVPSMFDSVTGFPCAYVDSCRPASEAEAFEYLWSNFKRVYEGNRAPFGLNMHAAWFFTEANLKAMHRFIERLLQENDIYIISAKRVLDWMRKPVKVSEVNTLAEWGCANPTPRPQSSVNTLLPVTTTPSTTLSTKTTTRQSSFTMTPSSDIGIRSPTVVDNYSETTQVVPKTTRISTTMAAPQTTASTVTEAGVTTYTPQTTASTETEAKVTIYTPLTTESPEVSEARVTTDIPETTASTETEAKVTTYTPLTTASPEVTEARVTTYTPQTSLFCVQGVNCHLPSCMCRNTGSPGNLAVKNTPQIITLTLNGKIDGMNFHSLLNVLSPTRTNPNNCPISATFFISKDGNYPPYVQNLRNSGHEMAMYGSEPYQYNEVEPLEQQVLAELAEFRSLANSNGLSNRSGSANLGWRSPSGVSLDTGVLSALQESAVKYDSSIVRTRRIGGEVEPLAWPYTLDFGWKDQCSSGEELCPRQRYPGLWEVPIVPLVDYKQQYLCVYPDACINSPTTAADTFDFLLNNFNQSYSTNRAPFGINLRQDWFSHPSYAANLDGIRLFLDAVLKSIPGVYVLSVEKMLKWLESPVGLDAINSFVPWQC